MSHSQTVKVLYPASHEVANLSHSQLALKIARHSPCSACDTCTGLHPSQDVEVVLGHCPGSGGDDGTAMAYLEKCGCGHALTCHGANEVEVGRDEFARRGRVAVRLDEFLQDAGKLLDFNYTDESIAGLRPQMQLPAASLSPTVKAIPSPGLSINMPSSPASSELSDLSPPAKRRRRASTSSLSEDEDEDEDQPLAARIALKTAPRVENGAIRMPTSGKRSGKKSSSMKSKAQSTPISVQIPTSARAEVNGVVNGLNGHDHMVKSEERMDEGQLDRLATGVTVDTGGDPGGVPPAKVEKAATIELRTGIIQITSVENDGHPRSFVILTGLKTLFQKQLPKMPRDYIARLVYDSNSRCMAIIKRGYKVVGGICYRPFPHRGFAEIVFFATASVDQVKGYGGMLMDHFKHHIKSTYPDMMHFLTYADNYAVGYFRKQGFSKEITLDRSIWAGYIKDYEGGTIMQCTMLRKVNYLEKADIIAQQKNAISTKIREMSKSHYVYDGLPQFQDPNAGEVSVDPQDVPGLKETGWQFSMATMLVHPVRDATRQFMQRLLAELQTHPLAWAFNQPVNKNETPDYYEVIKQPMDFSLMEHKLETNQYPTIDTFLTDTQLVFDNCRKYNPEDSIYSKNAVKLEKFVNENVAKFKQREH